MPASGIFSKKKGLIILYIFLLMLTITAVMTGFVGSSLQDMRFFNDYESEMQATWLAFGGIAKGADIIANDKNFTGSVPEEKIGSGTLEIEISKTLSGQTKIISCGIVNKVKIKAEKEIST